MSRVALTALIGTLLLALALRRLEGLTEAPEDPWCLDLMDPPEGL